MRVFKGPTVTALGSLILQLLAVISVGASQIVHGSYWYIIDNIQAPAPGAVARIWVALPADRQGQEIRITTFEPQPLEIVTDSDQGNRIIFWEIRPPADAQHIFCHYDFTAELTSVMPDINPNRIEAYDTDNHLYQRFTRDEFGIETTSELQTLARRIVGTEKNPYHRAKSIYDWVVANCEFVPGGYGERTALSMYRNRRGDCTQYSLLFTALCRAQGIPARTLTCEWLSGGRHVLAEFYLPPYGWLAADPSIAQLLLPDYPALARSEVAEFFRSRGIETDDPNWFFGNLYQNRLITTVGNNIEIPGPSPDEILVFTFLSPGGIHAQPPAFDFTGLGDEVVHGGFFHYGDQVLDEEAVHEVAHQRLASLYFDAGLYAEAEAGCLQTLETNPNGVAAWINLGRVYLRKGDYERAEASFKRALTGQFTLPEEKLESLIWVHNYLGNCYDLMGKRNLARREYEHVVELDVNYRGAIEYARQYLNTPFKEEDF